jgi:hypothetical protein
MNSSTTPVAELDGLVLADVLRAGMGLTSNSR